MKTKQRGLQHKCQKMVAHMREQTQTFPKPHYQSDYWHLHLPVAQSFIDSEALPQGVRRLCVQTLIDRACFLSTIAPLGEGATRVVVAVTLPDLWTSQIIIFFGPEYFDNFFDRRTDAQSWSIISDKSLVKAYDLRLPIGFSEKGYKEEIVDEDQMHKRQIWFIGQLSPI